MTDYEAVQSLKNNEAMAMGVIIGIIVLVVGFTFGLFEVVPKIRTGG